jgi:adenylate kinase family enzyme
MRIHIIGGPGSGKTTLALKLTKDLHIPFYELDSIWWNEKRETERSLAEVLPCIDYIATRAAWITEGTDITCINKLLCRANYIIWLDVPWPLALWHIVTRHIRTTIQRTNRYPGIFRLLQFMKDSMLYYISSNNQNDQYTRSATIRILSNFESKTKRCASRKEAEAIFKIILADTSIHKSCIPVGSAYGSTDSSVRYTDAL